MKDDIIKDDITDNNINTSYEIEANSLVNASFLISNINYSDDIPLDSMRHYIKYPMIYNRILREISRRAYNSNGIYANVIDYLVAIPTLDSITSYRKRLAKLKKHKENIDLLLKKINHKRTTRDILRHLLIDGMYVGILRNTSPTNKKVTPLHGYNQDKLEGLAIDNNIMIQPLDLDYCKVIGFQSNVSVAAFNMQYFDQFKYGGLLNEIKNFPKDFQKAYIEYKKDSNKQWYILPTKTTIALKSRANEIEAYGRPFGLAAFADMKFADDYASSQHKLIYELASSIYYLILPEGEKKGSSSLNKEQQKNIISAFENAVKVNTSTGDNAKISTLSLAPGSEVGRLAKDSSLLKDTLSNENIKQISTSLGFASSALNADNQNGSSYSSLAVNIDLILSQVFELLDNISSEYTRVLNNLVGNTEENNYIDITYLRVSTLNQEKMYDRAKELYTLAGGSRKYLIACAGFDVEQYLQICDEEQELGFDEKYPPHPTSYTLSGGADGGRPKKSDDELTDDGIKTRTSGGNEMKKPNMTNK